MLLRTHRDFGQQPRDRLTSFPGTNPNILLWVWSQMRNYNSQEGIEIRRYMIQCALERMRKYIKKSVNYEKIKEMT